MDTQTRRLSLQTKFTDYRNLNGYPKSAFTVAYSPYLASPTSPKYIMRGDSSPRVDSIRRHEIVMDEGVDPRKRTESRTGRYPPQARPVSPPPYSAATRDQGRNLTPIAEYGQAPSPNGWPGPSSSLTQARRSAGMPIPRHLSLSEEPRRHTIVDETRQLLLTGVPPSALRSVAAAPSPRDRRLSHPVTPLTARRRSYHAMRDRKDYLAYGHLEGHPLEADCLVAAFALRRNSAAVSPTEDGDKAKSAGKDENPKPAEKDTKKQNDTKDQTDNKVTIRVRVHPRDPARQAFLMQRNLDVEELRGTIPQPPSTPMTARGPMSARPPMSARLAVPDNDRHQSTDMHSPAEAETPGLRGGRRASSVSDQGREGGQDPLDRDMFRRAKAIPMHLDIARESLPVLAVLMLTGHLRKGDLVDLPIPHPEVWPQTVAYVYTPDRVELTEPMRENIMYLGGKVASCGKRPVS